MHAHTPSRNLFPSVLPSLALCPCPLVLALLVTVTVQDTELTVMVVLMDTVVLLDTAEVTVLLVLPLAL